MRKRIDDVVMLCAAFALGKGGGLYFGTFGIDQDKTAGIAWIALSAALVAVVKSSQRKE